MLSFGIKVFKWVSHDSESFRKTPKYFTLIVGIIFWPLILKLRYFFYLLGFVFKGYYFCFPSIKEEFVTTNPLTENFEVTVYKFVDFLRDFSANKSIVSSAKWCKELFKIALCHSLIKSRNNKGPSADPCGTPCEDISLCQSCIL